MNTRITSCVIRVKILKLPKGYVIQRYLVYTATLPKKFVAAPPRAPQFFKGSLFCIHEALEILLHAFVQHC